MFIIPKLNKVYELQEDYIRQKANWNERLKCYDGERIPEGSRFKITVIHYSKHQNYCTLQFAKKWNKDSPLKEACKFAVTVQVLCNLKVKELEDEV